MSDTIRYEARAGVGLITLDRPQSKNAIDIVLRTELRELLEELRYDRSLKALILTGAGGNFCSGGDLGTLRGDAPAAAPGAEARRQRLVDLHPLVNLLIHFDRPVIAAVQGIAYGAGLGLALTADLVLAADDARFCAAFGRVGAIPDFGSLYTLPRFVGLQRAKELVYSAREFDAAEAQRLGLALEVHAPAQLLERAFSMARSLADASRATLSIAKRALDVSLHSDLHTMLLLESDGQGVALSSEYHAEALRRFFAKEGPAFRWPAAPGSSA